jgi:branched-chain amino acid transport system substrate-binding protein
MATRREALRTLVAGSAALAVGRSGGAMAQQPPIRVGALYPLTGPSAVVGNATVMGSRIAAAQVNRAGGVLGRQIEIVVRDDKVNPAEAALMARDLTGSGVNLLVGGYLSAPALAVIGLLNETKAVFQCEGAALMSITHEGFNPNAFRAGVNNRISFYSLAKCVAARGPAVSRWGAVIPDVEFGHANLLSVSNGLKKFSGGRPMEFLAPQLTKFGAPDYRVQIAQLMSQPIDGLFVGVVGADFTTFMSQAAPFGLLKKVKVILDGAAGMFPYAKSAKTAIPNNVWTLSPWDPELDTHAESRALFEEYVKLAGDRSPDPQVGVAHDMVLAYANAIRAAGSTDSAAVAKALENVDFAGAKARFRYRKEDHQSLYTMNVFRMEGADNERGFVHRDAMAVPGEDVVEPAAPGQKYEEAAS